MLRPSVAQHVTKLVVLHRYYREIFVDVFSAGETQSGEREQHRSRRRTSSDVLCNKATGEQSRRQVSKTNYLAVLRAEEYAIAADQYRGPAQGMLQTVSNQENLMVHLENLGHTPSPQVQGLNVDLLPFQRQSLQWCLDREQVAGGIQPYLCPMLPFVEEPDTQVWYNLITGRLTQAKPALRHGGFLAEQIGLGKTVITLAQHHRNDSQRCTTDLGHKSADQLSPSKAWFHSQPRNSCHSPRRLPCGTVGGEGSPIQASNSSETAILASLPAMRL